MFKSIKPAELEYRYLRIYVCKLCPKGWPNKYLRVHKGQKFCLGCERKLIHTNEK